MIILIINFSRDLKIMPYVSTPDPASVITFFNMFSFFIIKFKGFKQLGGFFLT